jgi:stalled ribosome alternative rescue factor ArfA
MVDKMRIRRVNPVAKAQALTRRRQQIVQGKKGKGSYDRTKAKKIRPEEKEES